MPEPQELLKQRYVCFAEIASSTNMRRAVKGSLTVANPKSCVIATFRHTRPRWMCAPWDDRYPMGLARASD
jgi:hypothetical protein